MEEEGTAVAPAKRGRGRPPGSKNVKKPAPKATVATRSSKRNRAPSADEGQRKRTRQEDSPDAQGDTDESRDPGIAYGDHLEEDLFRYGLKVDMSHQKVGKCDHDTWHSPYPGIWMCQDLRILMSHPIWKDDIAAVRTMLQYAVFYRVPGHVEPIEPVRFSEADQMQHLQGPSLRDVLRDTVIPEGSAQESAGPKSRSPEQTLFFLRPGDVKAVRRALDRLTHTDTDTDTVGLFRPCKSYYDEFCDHMGRKPDVEPLNLEDMKRWKKHYSLAFMRDWVIAKRKRHLGNVLLRDTVERDGKQWHILYPDDRVLSERRFDAVVGDVWPFPEWENMPYTLAMVYRSAGTRAKSAPGAADAPQSST
ncbi:hypothetical protein VTJ49DRAFT_4046 [Mycothermus thermophilus]|uniref:Uncharacterized protein n=1 Tax=Humicola insolens TaxID=85995 RepID=A0ABR3V890_HUMIN